MKRIKGIAGIETVAVIVVIAVAAVLLRGGQLFTAVPPDCAFSGETTNAGIAACTSDYCTFKFDTTISLLESKLVWHINIEGQSSSNVIKKCYEVRDTAMHSASYLYGDEFGKMTSGVTWAFVSKAYAGSCGDDTSFIGTGSGLNSNSRLMTLYSYSCGNVVQECMNFNEFRCQNNVPSVCASGVWSDFSACPSGTTCTVQSSGYQCVGTVTCGGKSVGSTQGCSMGGISGIQICTSSGVWGTCTIQTDVCGNNACQGSESYVNCPDDCPPPNVDRTIPEGGLCGVSIPYSCQAGTSCRDVNVFSGLGNCKAVDSGGNICASEGQSVGGFYGIAEMKCCQYAADGKTSLVKGSDGICKKQEFPVELVITIAAVIGGLALLSKVKI